MQEAFLCLYRELSEGRDVDEPKPWVFRVAYNLAIDCLRKKSRTELSEADGWWSFARPVKDGALVQDRILKQQQRACVRKALASLSPQQRRCLELRAEGLTYRQIAATLELAISSVQNHLSRAIQRVQDELGL
jgi:RNA polymerase sigma-70 factor (ECF subfamily)